LVCGENNKEVTKQQFLAGCNRFGIDNPCPIITKRMSNFGNSEDLDKEYKKFVEKYKATGVCFACSGPAPIVPDKLDKDPDIIAPADLKAINAFEVIGKKKFHDFNETKQRSPIKKLAGIGDFRLIKEPDGQTKEEKALKDTKDYIVGGVKMNILDI